MGARSSLSLYLYLRLQLYEKGCNNIFPANMPAAGVELMRQVFIYKKEALFFWVYLRGI